jgi:acyl-CoA synthetase (AMP-forming)/AMP-acid ligase II
MNNSMKDDLTHANQPGSGSTNCTQGLPNLIHLLRRRVQEHREKTVFTYLKDGESQETRLTYCELERRALAIAAYLQSHLAPGERVLLLFPPGIEFPTGFFGCLCAGMVAVPTYLPYSNRFLASLDATVCDARPTAALTTTSTLEEFRRQIDQIPGLMALKWIPTDTIPDDLATAWKEPSLDADSLAVLQYSSGSTGSPKGVMVSHGNLLHNSFRHPCSLWAFTEQPRRHLAAPVPRYGVGRRDRRDRLRRHGYDPDIACSLHPKTAPLAYGHLAL